MLTLDHVSSPDTIPGLSKLYEYHGLGRNMKRFTASTEIEKCDKLVVNFEAWENQELVLFLTFEV